MSKQIELEVNEHEASLGLAASLLKAAGDTDMPPHHRVAFLDAAKDIIDVSRGDLLGAPAPAPAPKPDIAALTIETPRAQRRKRKPRQEKVTQQKTRALPPPKRQLETAQHPPPAEGETITTEGVDVILTTDHERLEYGDTVIELRTPLALLAGALLAGFGSPIDRRNLIKALWDKAPSTADSVLGQYARELHELVAPAGLAVASIRGVGIVMRKAGQ